MLFNDRQFWRVEISRWNVIINWQLRIWNWKNENATRLFIPKVLPEERMIGTSSFFSCSKGGLANRQLLFGAFSHAQSIWPIMAAIGVSLKDNVVPSAIRMKLKFRRLPARNQKNKPYNRYLRLRGCDRFIKSDHPV